MINYLDRTVLGIAAPSLTKDLGLTPAQMGLVFSAFSWSYALLQIPGGIFLDRFGTRVTYFIAVVFWSVFTALMGMVAIAERAGPDAHRRRRVRGALLSGQQPHPGDVVSAAGAGARQLRSTRSASTSASAFSACRCSGSPSGSAGAACSSSSARFGVAFGVAWWRAVSRSGASSRRSNRAEIEHIEAGGGGEYKGEPVRFEWRHIAALLRHRQVLGASIGQFGGNSTQVFFVTWFPTYLVTARGMTFIQAGLMTSLPYIGASAGVLRRRPGLGHDSQADGIGEPGAEAADRRRHAAGLDDRRGQLRADGQQRPRDPDHVHRVLRPGHDQSGLDGVSDIAPKKLIGLTSGIFNFSANMAGIVTPLVIGIAFELTGSFVGPLVYIGVVALIGAFAYSVILGDIHRSISSRTDDAD